MKLTLTQRKNLLHGLKAARHAARNWHKHGRFACAYEYRNEDGFG